MMSCAVPCGLDSPSHSIAQASLPSNLPVLPPLSVPYELTPVEKSLHILPHMRTCRKLPLSSSCNETPLPTHIDGHSTSSQIPAPKLKPTAANIFSMEGSCFSLV
jgi:hypothetical protein